MTLYLSDRDGHTNDVVERMNSIKDKSCGHNFRKYFREYSEMTGIHGLRYLIEKRSRVEKILWAFLLLTSLGGCIYMIYEVLYKYNNGPVVVSFATEDTPLYQVPFPAVTICPEAKYSREYFNYSGTYFKIVNGEPVEDLDLRYFNYLNLVCYDTLNATESPYKIVENDFFTVIDKLKPNLTQMLLGCQFLDNEEEDCEASFVPIVTDEGICYTFNIIGREEIYREHVFKYKNYHYVKNNSKKDFDNEYGYTSTAGVNTYPRRALQSGADNSLTIFFRYDSTDTDFICNYFFQGFRVLIHNPWEVPRLSKHYFRIPFEKVVVAAMEPELITTSESVIKFKPEKRKCYMKNERPLQHFQYYSQSNCLLECLTNYTLKQCGCVEFFMPRDSKTPICGSGSLDCVEQADRQLKIVELESKLMDRSYCECKPSCTNLNFNVETSHSDFYFKEFFKAHPHLVEFQDDGAHWSVLQIYFKNEQFMKKERNELYGTSDLISNLGGLLGLFTGFSLISLVEIIYFCSVRLFYNERMYGMWSGPAK